jgi:hypothetical protein
MLAEPLCALKGDVLRDGDVVNHDIAEQIAGDVVPEIRDNARMRLEQMKGRCRVTDGQRYRDGASIRADVYHDATLVLQVGRHEVDHVRFPLSADVDMRLNVALPADLEQVSSVGDESGNQPFLEGNRSEIVLLTIVTPEMMLVFQAQALPFRVGGKPAPDPVWPLHGDQAPYLVWPLLEIHAPRSPLDSDQQGITLQPGPEACR